MTVELTELAALVNQQSGKTPNIVVKFTGVDTCYGAVSILKLGTFDEGHLFDDGLQFDSLVAEPDQSTLISLSRGTTTNISQNVDIDKGRGNSIQSMQLALIDSNLEMTDLITPGNVVTDILGNEVEVFYGFQETAFPEDYIKIFIGNVDQVDSIPGLVTFNVSHPDNKKRANLFTKATSELDGSITDVQTSLVLDNASDFFEPVVGPDAITIDSTIKYYVRIEDEIIQYTGITSNTLTGLTRGELSTTAAAHGDAQSVESFIRLSGNVISDVALKLMLSGLDGPYVEDVTITNFVRTSASETDVNTIFFEDQDLVDDFNVQLGDYITTTGASNGANNVSDALITGVLVTDTGTEIKTADTFVEELSTSAVASFRSQYDQWGAGRGMAMTPKEVDIARHDEIFTQNLSTFEVDYYIKEDMDNAKSFLDLKVYRPAGCVSLVRKARASVMIHNPPLPTETITDVGLVNVKNPSKLGITRSSSKNFYTGVVYRYDVSALEERFLTTFSTVSGDAKTRFGNNIPDKFLVIEADGMRTSLSAESLASAATSRRLSSYKFGAEYIRGVKLTLEGGLSLEAGDVVSFDMAGLQMSDITTGDRSGEPRLYRIDRKQFNIKTGEVVIDLVDTNFDKDARYGLISGASQVKTGNSTTEFIIKESFGGKFGQNEFLKWEDLVGITVRVRNADYSLDDTAILESVVGNTITVATALAFTPSTDMILEAAPYDEQPTGDVVDNYKLKYVSTSDDSNDFGDGKPPYVHY